EHIVAAKAVAFKEAQSEEFQAYQRQIVANAKTLAAALVRGGARIVSGGTDTHLMLVDVTPLGLTGQAAETALEHAGITCNKNAIPFDPNPPAVASGIRLGTPALTTRGMKESQMEQIAEWIVDVLKAPADEARSRDIRGRVSRLCDEFPLYKERLERSAEPGVKA
ncbi:MAG: serine hydroxymethyltransferase, partial [Candidatus Eremiobacterota bacterium]